MSLTDFAENELRLAGVLDDDGDYGGMTGRAVMDLVRVFAAQGHSGGSAFETIELFRRVASYEPLTPLTYGPEQWIDRTAESGRPMWQHLRDSRVFSTDHGETHYSIEDQPAQEVQS